MRRGRCHIVGVLGALIPHVELRAQTGHSYTLMVADSATITADTSRIVREASDRYLVWIRTAYVSPQSAALGNELTYTYSVFRWEVNCGKRQVRLGTGAFTAGRIARLSELSQILTPLGWTQFPSQQRTSS
jgi:hypothetical protein